MDITSLGTSLCSDLGLGIFLKDTGLYDRAPGILFLFHCSIGLNPKQDLLEACFMTVGNNWLYSCITSMVEEKISTRRPRFQILPLEVTTENVQPLVLIG